MRAMLVRSAVIKTVLPNVMEELLWAAASGQMEALIKLPCCGKLDPLSVAEAICEGLASFDIMARPVKSDAQDRWGNISRTLVIQATWRDAR